ncbi:MAG: hypothetical protein E4H28_00200 [Gemmatimonadales bacterium]|nr:MAG: hypothetical protein E4H28_00200 [Gemmatimonadales bacterium]
MSKNLTMNGHLTSDELELATANFAGLGDTHRKHVDACQRCAAGVIDAREVSVALRSLPVVSPRPGFAERVMSRVTLPLPWHRRAAAAAWERKSTSASVAAVLTTLVAGAGVWAIGFPELRPVALATWIAGQAGDLVWQATIGLGRVAYSVGLADLANAIGADLTMGSAIAGLATVALMSIGSMSVMIRLIRENQPELARTR